MKNSIVLILLMLIIFSCSKKTVSTASTQSPTRLNDSTATSGPVDMIAAENLFKETCSSCHKLPKTTKHTAEDWPKTVNRMQGKRKAKFDDKQKDMILAYLVANARP